MTAAFGYIRLSRADTDSTSPQRQRKAIEDYCASHGWELVESFEDLDVSGRADRRPGLDRMLSRLGDVDRIVFWKLDRLYRGMIGFGKVVEAAQAANVALVSTSEPFDTSTPMGEAMMWLLGVFAQLEVRVMAERSRNMHSYLRANGRVQTRVPFGWRKGADGRLEGVPEEQATLREMAEELVAGASLRQLSGKFGMEHTSIRHMLRSDKVLDALGPLGEAVRGELQRRESGFRGGSKSLLSGIAKCGVCSGPMKMFARRPPRGKATYGCRASGHVYVGAEWLDDHVSQAVLRAIDKGKLAKRFAKKKKPPATDVEVRLEALEVDYYERGIIGRDSYMRRREGLLARLAASREAPREDVRLPRELALHLDERWVDLTVGERRRIIAAAVERVEIHPAAAKGRYDSSRVKIVWR
jgi:DNA invertase Pin-like site-specific DNA recombinase